MSKIKGGGRAQLSNDAKESIISLLYDLRDHENPLLPAVTTQFESQYSSGDNGSKKKARKVYNELSDHDKKKGECKSFLKKLWSYHSRHTLSNRFNQSDTGAAHSDTSFVKVGKSIMKQEGIIHGTEKVRIQLVEMIFKEKKDKENSSKKEKENKKSVKNSKKTSWKEGAKKTIVIPRNTTIEELMVQCKGKLNMKKPSRIFIIDPESKMKIDLVNNLCSLKDGSTVYVTSYITQADQNKINKEEKESLTEGDSLIIDPLENVKKAYRLSRHRQKKNRKFQFTNEKFPPFSTAISKLEPLSESRSKLPAAKYRSAILESLDSSRVIVITGATGCGKSTQIPQFILEGMRAIQMGEQTNIMVTQPRRVAAMTLAKRVAEERNSPPPGRDGSEIGYNVRLNKAVSDDAKIVYCTVGVLLRMIVNPQECNGDQGENVNQQASIPLSSISTVVIDEVHERDLTTDFALTLLRPILLINKRISIILMSATTSASLFVDFFHNMEFGIEPKVFDIPGRTFPVETMWLTECEKMLATRMKTKEDIIHVDKNKEVIQSPRVMEKTNYDFIARLLLYISQKQWDSEFGKNDNGYKESGSILVFLPGKGEIESLMRTLQRDQFFGDSSKCSILKLYSSLPPSEQWRAFQPVKNGVVKIVLSTNVAETSITIPDISVVIDIGQVKEMRFNPETRIKELVTVWTSQASSKQRAGRGGRTGPGICYKLYTEKFEQSQMPRQTLPEIMRTPLEELVLQVCLLKEQRNTEGTNPAYFLMNAPEPPPESNVEMASLHLQEIGALIRLPHNKNTMFRLTPLGYHLSHLPMDPKIGKILVVGCILQCIEPALTVAATLSSPSSIWLPNIPGVEKSGQIAKLAQENLIENGFGGASWKGGTVKGDSIASVAAYNAWSSSATSSTSHPDKQRRMFAAEHALNQNALCDIRGLRSQFKDALRTSGLLRAGKLDNIHGDDALLTSCCLVAGLYPNIASLVRPSKELKINRAFLITKYGDKCRSSSDSFQCDRIRKATESRRDAYAVFHSKHLITGTQQNGLTNPRGKREPSLSNINFVSKFAILLFGGDIEVRNNCLVVDEWLKFKVDDMDQVTSGKSAKKGQENAILISELRKELDFVLLRHIMNNRSDSSGDSLEQECERVIQVVRKILHTDTLSAK